MLVIKSSKKYDGERSRDYEVQDIIHLLNHKNTASINPNEVLCIKSRKFTKINVRISLHDNVNL